VVRVPNTVAMNAQITKAVRKSKHVDVIKRGAVRILWHALLPALRALFGTPEQNKHDKEE